MTNLFPHPTAYELMSTCVAIRCLHIHFYCDRSLIDNLISSYSSSVHVNLCCYRLNAASQLARSLTSRISWFVTIALIKPLKSSMTCILQHGNYLQFLISLPHRFTFKQCGCIKCISALNHNALSCM